MSLEESFASNLRTLRKKHGINQKELALAIGCSEKAVSKWECAASIPDIEILLSIAKTFQTSVENLFANTEKYYLLGIDGGGTKTHLMLADANGEPIRELRTEQCNPIDIGIERAQEILRNAIFEICDGLPFSSIACYAGIAGGTSGGIESKLREFFKGFGFYAVENNSDNKNIIAAALGDDDGITLILGTGVCSYLQKNCVHTHKAGNGFFIDDGGSGFDIGRQGLVAYYSEKDGVGKKTAITGLIDELGLDLRQGLLSEIYKQGKKYIASFSRYVYTAAKNGDEVALKIIEDNMKRAATFVLANASELELETIPLIVAGGLTNEPLTLDYLKKALGSKYKFDIRVLDCAPVIGAVKIAEKLFKKRSNEKK